MLKCERDAGIKKTVKKSKESIDLWAGVVVLTAYLSSGLYPGLLYVVWARDRTLIMVVIVLHLTEEHEMFFSQAARPIG